MKSIKNMRLFILGIIMLVLTVACVCLYLFAGHETRFLVSSIIGLALAVVSFIGAFTGK